MQDWEKSRRVRELIGNRNFPGMEEYLDSIEVRRSSREGIGSTGRSLRWRRGAGSGRKYCTKLKAIMAVHRLKRI